MEKTAYARVSKERLKMLEGRANDCKRAEEEYESMAAWKADTQRKLNAQTATLEDALAIMETLNRPVWQALVRLRAMRWDAAVAQSREAAEK